MIKQENTYLGADGLAYCKICGEPVEAFFPPDSSLVHENPVVDLHLVPVRFCTGVFSGKA